MGAHDLTFARVAEPHLDAVAILAEAGRPVPDGTTWGVWAAEGPGARLEGRQTEDGGWRLEGRKPWCSLAGTVTHALVTAWTGPEQRRLFAIDLAAPGLRVEDDTWVPAGLARVVTTSVGAHDVPAEPVGADCWYLSRDGFWWGGVGVAAVWFGGAVGLARRLMAHVASREPDQIALMHLGEVDTALTAARSTLAEAAGLIDSPTSSQPGSMSAAVLATRVRNVVASTVETVGRHVAHAVGPGPLSQEAEHVTRVADLGLYVRQHHAERDAAGLGRMVAEQAADEASPW